MSKHDAPAVDSLEQVMHLVDEFAYVAGQCAVGIIATGSSDDRKAEFNQSRASIESAIAALTHPPGGSERLRELVAKWRADADRLNKSYGPGDMVLAAGRQTCATELEATLASPQGAEPDRVATALRDALAYVGQRTDGDLATLAERAELWMRESNSLLAAQGAEQRQEVDPERVAQLIAHRACCGVEHDPANGKLHGCCVVCGVDWPCEYAGKPPATPHPEQAASQGDAVERVAYALQHADGNAYSFEHYCELAKAALSSPTGVQATQVSDAEVYRAARVLSDRRANACNIDRNDNWHIYSDDFVADTRAMLEAIAHPISAAHGGEVSDA